MNPQMNQDNGLNLAPPAADGAATMPLPPAAPLVPAAEPPMSVASPVLRPTVPVHAVPAEPAQDTTAGTAQPDYAAATPDEAADNDVIEREWVVKAKAVVAETRHDPYKQVQELNKIKADYMKKRYDKDIKLADE